MGDVIFKKKWWKCEKLLCWPISARLQKAGESLGLQALLSSTFTHRTLLLCQNIGRAQGKSLTPNKNRHSHAQADGWLQREAGRRDQRGTLESAEIHNLNQRRTNTLDTNQECSHVRPPHASHTRKVPTQTAPEGGRSQPGTVEVPSWEVWAANLHLWGSQDNEVPCLPGHMFRDQ